MQEWLRVIAFVFMTLLSGKPNSEGNEIGTSIKKLFGKRVVEILSALSYLLVLLCIVMPTHIERPFNSTSSFLGILILLVVILFWLMSISVLKETTGTHFEKPIDICGIIRALIADAKEEKITGQCLPRLLDDIGHLVKDLDGEFRKMATRRAECNSSVNSHIYMVVEPFKCESPDCYTAGSFRVFPIVRRSDMFEKLKMTMIGEILEREFMSRPHAKIHLITRPNEDKGVRTSLVNEIEINKRDDDKEGDTSSTNDFPVHHQAPTSSGNVIEVQERDNNNATSLMNEFQVYARNEDKEVLSLACESRIYGRREDKQVLVKMLLGKQICHDLVSAIPIVGVAGIGKTTLVKLVYDDRSVNENFHLKAWVCAPQKFDVIMITRTIFEAMTSMTAESMDLNALQLSLKEKLSRSKFLLVLDDVSNVNRESWDLLYHPFQFGLPGSRFIVITCDDAVAAVVDSARIANYHMKLLTDDDCLALLAQYSLRSFNGSSEFGQVGKRLARRCKGLPLAAKMLGGILRYKEEREEWYNLLNSNMWNFHEEHNILPVLRLSYLHLPSHLKYLFAFCSLLPKGCELDKNDMLSLWIREGLLEEAGGRERKEELGHKFLNELLSRSFLQRSNGCESLFLMHNLIHDLAQFVAGGKCHRLNERMHDTDQESQLTEDNRLDMVMQKISGQPLGF